MLTYLPRIVLATSISATMASCVEQNNVKPKEAGTAPVIRPFFPATNLAMELAPIQVSPKWKDVTERIAKTMSISPNYVLISSATHIGFSGLNKDGKRLIGLNSTALAEAEQKYGWEVPYYVVAHEIGHHVNGDILSVSKREVRQSQEYAADIYAKGVIDRLDGDLGVVYRFLDSRMSGRYFEDHLPKEIRLSITELVAGVACDEDAACLQTTQKFPPFPLNPGVEISPGAGDDEQLASLEPTAAYRFENGVWVDGREPPVSDARRLADKYAIDTIGEWDEVAPAGHDHENIGVRICGDDDQYYQLTITDFGLVRYVPYSSLSAQQQQQVTGHSAAFRQSLALYNRTAIGERLFQRLDDC